ncbi:MAG: hypothetical protein NVS4B13_03150 [Candidatus Elarobacter sp.]
MGADENGTERYQGGNVLIDALPPRDVKRLERSLEVFRPEVPDCVVAHGSPFEDVLFPIDAIFSVTAELTRGHVYEVAAIGRQGVIGAEIALGVDSAPRSIMTQIDGRSARMSRFAFAECYRTARRSLAPCSAISSAGCSLPSSSSRAISRIRLPNGARDGS